jgi:hypothetical protein
VSSQNPAVSSAAPTIVGSAGGDDRLVERGQQHAKHEPAEHDAELPLAERAGWPGVGSVRLGGQCRHAGSFGLAITRVAER